MKRGILFSVITATAFPLIAPAETGNETDKFDLGVVEVTGHQTGGLEQPKVDVLTAADIRKHARTNVADALNLVPGVTVQNLGARGEQLIFVRGFNSRQVPLFIDGIPVYVPYDGNIDLGRFMTFDIAEINVAKGFSSVLYGPNTMGGAINLVSRRPSRKFQGDVTAGLTMDSEFDVGAYRTDFNFGSNQGLWYVQLGGSYSERDFFRLSDDFSPSAASVEDGGRRDNSANQDHKVSLKLGFTPNATDEYAISYYNQQGEKEVPLYAGRTPPPDVRPRFWRWPEYDKESIYFISRTHFDKHYVKLRAYYDTFTNTLDSFDNVTFTTQTLPFAFNDSVYDDYTYGGGVEFGTEYFNHHLIKAAFSYKRDIHRETDSVGLPEERFEDEVMSFGLEDTIMVTEKFSLVGGASYDRQTGIRADERRVIAGNSVILPFPTDTQEAVNLQGGVFYKIDDVTRLHVTLGNRTRFPTIKDRYSSRFGSAEPSPGLDPESALNTEIGLAGSVGILDYGAAVFWSSIEDAIENVTLPPTACANPPCSQLQNIGKQTNKGLELYVDLWPVDNLRIHADWTYLHRENKSSPTIMLLDTPQHKAFSYIEFKPLEKLSLLGSVEYQSSRFSNTTGTRIAKGFVSGNVLGVLQLPSGFSTEFGVKNIADRHYEYEEGFPEPGRTYFANLRFTY